MPRSAFNHKPIVVHDKDGRPAEAKLLLCPHCGHPEFIMYVLDRGRHEHVQCIRCGASFCDQTCDRETSNEVANRT